MIEHVGGIPESHQSSFLELLKSIMVLRLGAGVLLLVTHGIAAGQGAYHFLWDEQPWEWVTLFHEAGIPWPHLAAPAAAVAIIAVAASWIAGFLTRLFAFVFLPMAAAFAILAEKADSSAAETGWLYFLVAFTLMLFGSGSVSLDKLFHIGESWASAPKKKKGW